MRRLFILLCVKLIFCSFVFRSMKQNLIVFLADLFNVLEINPVKCVRYPGMDKLSNGK